MLKYKVGSDYVAANQVEVVRMQCPVTTTTADSGGFMKVINGVWAVSHLFSMWVNSLTHVLNVISSASTVSSTTFALPTEANVTIDTANHQLVRS